MELAELAYSPASAKDSSPSMATSSIRFRTSDSNPSKFASNKVFTFRSLLQVSHNVKAGDEVHCTISKLQPLRAEPEDIPLDIVYEDQHVLVVNKPPHMVVTCFFNTLKRLNLSRLMFTNVQEIARQCLFRRLIEDYCLNRRLNRFLEHWC